MKRRILYEGTFNDVYLCSIVKQNSLKDDLSCLIHCLYKNLNIEMFKNTDMLFLMHRRTKNV